MMFMIDNDVACPTLTSAVAGEWSKQNIILDYQSLSNDLLIYYDPVDFGPQMLNTVNIALTCFTALHDRLCLYLFHNSILLSITDFLLPNL